jgi:dipeptidyl aminopeptidase/acylaminoacyl peptidase
MLSNSWIENRFKEKLETVIRKPEGDGVLPTIILVPGIGATLHETNNAHDEMAQVLCDAGFATIQFSFAGRGGSEGKYEEMTLTRQGNQVDDVVEWTRKQTFCDPKRIGIYAMSFGVASALCSSLQNVTSLCFISGAYSPGESLQEMFRLKGEYNPDGISWRKFSTGEIVRFPASFWQDLKLFDCMKAASLIIIPTMIIHGDNDAKISHKEAQSVYDAIKCEKKIKIFSGGDHGIVDVPRPMRDEFLHVVVEWFRETLK